MRSKMFIIIGYIHITSKVSIVWCFKLKLLWIDIIFSVTL